MLGQKNLTKNKALDIIPHHLHKGDRTIMLQPQNQSIIELLLLNFDLQFKVKIVCISIWIRINTNRDIKSKSCGCRSRKHTYTQNYILYCYKQGTFLISYPKRIYLKHKNNLYLSYLWMVSMQQ